jgi:hypothetical protein
LYRKFRRTVEGIGILFGEKVEGRKEKEGWVRLLVGNHIQVSRTNRKKKKDPVWLLPKAVMS